MQSNALLKDLPKENTQISEQLDLFKNNNNGSESISLEETKNITTNNVSLLLNNNGEFLRTEKINFSEVNISIINDMLSIKFTIRTNSNSGIENDDLFIDIDINKTQKYNNITIKHSKINTMGMRLEVLKYFVTAEGFHKLMTKIFLLSSLSNNLKNTEYHHEKHGSLKDYKEKEKSKYTGEKGILGKIGLSNNHFPELFLLKDNCEVNFIKDQFTFSIEIEIHKKIFVINGKGIKTIDNTGNHQEKISNVIVNEFNITTENNFSDEIKRQIERYINYYICNL